MWFWWHRAVAIGTLTSGLLPVSVCVNVQAGKCCLVLTLKAQRCQSVCMCACVHRHPWVIIRDAFSLQTNRVQLEDVSPELGLVWAFHGHAVLMLGLVLHTPMLGNLDRKPLLCTSNVVSGSRVVSAVCTCAGEVLSCLYIIFFPEVFQNYPSDT